MSCSLRRPPSRFRRISSGSCLGSGDASGGHRGPRAERSSTGVTRVAIAPSLRGGRHAWDLPRPVFIWGARCACPRQFLPPVRAPAPAAAALSVLPTCVSLGPAPTPQAHSGTPAPTCFGQRPSPFLPRVPGRFRPVSQELRLCADREGQFPAGQGSSRQRGGDGPECHWLPSEGRGAGPRTDRTPDQSPPPGGGMLGFSKVICYVFLIFLLLILT